MTNFAELEDVLQITGKDYTTDEMIRIETLIPLVCDALRVEAAKVGKDLDALADGNAAFASVAKLVVVDVVTRAMRQSVDREPLSQESQSGLGYTWSGTYAIPGGGISGAIMRNDLKRLGLRRQQYGVMELWEADCTE